MTETLVSNFVCSLREHLDPRRNVERTLMEDAAWNTFNTDRTPPPRLIERKLREDPKMNESIMDNFMMLPNVIAPVKDRVEPQRANERIETLDPMSAKSNADNVSPHRTKDRKLTLEERESMFRMLRRSPKRATRRRLKELPSATWHNTLLPNPGTPHWPRPRNEIEEPSCRYPIPESMDFPKLAKERREMPEAMQVESKTDVQPPIRQCRPRTDNVDPRSVECRTDTLVTDPNAIQPSQEKEEPIRTKLRVLREDPKWTASRIEKDAPNLAWVRTLSAEAALV
jgi:hypothetical protein